MEMNGVNMKLGRISVILIATASILILSTIATSEYSLTPHQSFDVIKYYALSRVMIISAMIISAANIVLSAYLVEFSKDQTQ
jgi:hypothetical protein